MTYQFWGWEQAEVPPIDEEYKKIRNPRELYDALSEIWCADTCAPRMRDCWSKENKTLGQCSITAFLAQDIFGGKVYGILLPDGSIHCYNVVGDCRFDLTSEQFAKSHVSSSPDDGNGAAVILNYEGNSEQSREVHFAKEEKRLRYEYLRRELRERLNIEAEG